MVDVLLGYTMGHDLGISDSYVGGHRTRGDWGSLWDLRLEIRETNVDELRPKTKQTKQIIP